MKFLNRLFSYFLARLNYKHKIARLLGIDITRVDRIYREIEESPFMQEIINKTGSRRGFFDFSMSSVLRAPTLYTLCRIIKPEIIVETGVADGFSSAFILNALEVNQKGHLYSIDLPNQPGQELREGKATGWLVTENLKKRWTLILGSSQEKLPPLLESLKKIDIFYHDSGHSYENMMFEFKMALGYVNERGHIISDDITDNNAFRDFYISTNSQSLRLFKLGIMKK